MSSNTKTGGDKGATADTPQAVLERNASLIYRLANGRSPKSLSELSDGDYVDTRKIICPHGGAYAFDAENDTCTCTLHNRLKYLTPNAELEVQMVWSVSKEARGALQELVLQRANFLAETMEERLFGGNQLPLVES